MLGFGSASETQFFYQSKKVPVPPGQGSVSGICITGHRDQDGGGKD